MSIQVKGLDGKRYSWNLANYSQKQPNLSKLQDSALQVLKRLMPFDIILAEVHLPGCGLYADFYIHARRLMIEVDGSQHDIDNHFFFDSKHDFYKAQARDRRKQEWCEINNITLIRLKYNESEREWEQKILQRPT